MILNFICTFTGNIVNVNFNTVKDEKQYVRRTPKEVKEYLDGFDKGSLKIVGTFDKYSPREMEELEL